MSTTSSPPVVHRATRATAVVFAANGLVMASWLSRIPVVKADLGLSPGRLGLLLLCMSLGAVTALPAAGAIEHRLGSARTVRITSAVNTVGLALVGVGGGLAAGHRQLATTLIAVGLVIAGSGAGVWDVAMNVHGAVVEQARGRALMPRLHAGFSLGTVLGAGLGAATLKLGIGTTWHLVAVAVVVLVGVQASTRSFLTAEPVPDAPSTRSALGAAWRDPRTLTIGVLTLAFAFTEGTANEWLGVSVVDGLGADAAVGAVAFGVFVSAMTVGRWFGTPVLDRFGRTRCLQATAVCAIGGVLLVSVGGSVATALAGAVLWGIGASLGFPVGMSAAGDPLPARPDGTPDPRAAGVRVGVVSAIAYTAFLGGPPLIGFLADHVGVLDALLVVLVGLAAAVALARVARPIGAAVDGAPATAGLSAPMEP